MDDKDRLFFLFCFAFDFMEIIACKIVFEIFDLEISKDMRKMYYINKKHLVEKVAQMMKRKEHVKGRKVRRENIMSERNF